jgi:hypothetical protein
MNKRWMLAVCVAVLVVATGPAAGQLTLAPGSDIFTTGADGQTTVDLSQYPVSDAFGGQSVTPQIVTLSGKPIAGLGQTDTVVDRLGSVSFPGLHQPVSSRLRLTGLSLKGVVTVGGSEQWNLLVSVSPTVVSTGTITLTQTNSQGGSFDAAISVRPHLIFTNPSTGDTVTIDCGFECDPISLSSQNAPWVIATSGGFSPSAAGVPNIANNTAYDGDGDGFADDVYKKSNFYPGFEPVSPYVVVPVAHDHPPVAQHTQKPNTQCKKTVSTVSADSRATGEATAVAVLCAVIAEPKEPAEPTGTVDAG